MSDDGVQVFVGIGSNQEQPLNQVARACATLAGLPQCRNFQCSPFYRSPPMGPQDQPDYINAVAGFYSHQDPHALLKAFQTIERRQGRTRTLRWGPRTLDLDLLLYGDQVIVTDDLTVPHPGLPERAFVLYPLYDISPQLVVPGLGPLVELLERCSAEGIRRIE